MAISKGLSNNKVSKSKRCSCWLLQKVSGELLPSQSTTLPMAANNKASKPPMSPVNKVMPNINNREPLVQAQTKGHSALGGESISLSGNGFNCFSNQASMVR